MSRASTLILVGLLIILDPFSGLPATIRTLIAVAFGAIVVSIGVALRSHEQRRLVAAQSAPASGPAEPEPLTVEPLESHETPPRQVMSSF